MTLVGTAIGHIRIVEALGEGGMGEVYVGFDETLKRKVAVKVIRPETLRHPQAKARFLREARILSQLQHPNICQIHDYIEGDDRDYLVLELIQGRDLASALSTGLDKPAKLRIAERLVQVLEAAHEQGVVHRDLKPSNVMLTAEGEVKVLDFGLARVTVGAASGQNAPMTTDGRATDISALAGLDSTAPTPLMPESPEAQSSVSATAAMSLPGSLETLRTQPGSIVGTPAYMSPEQARGELPTAASDMYSFGLVLQTLFTDKRPYPRGLESPELLDRVMRGNTLPVTGVDAQLTQLINQLKSLAPTARPTAVETAHRLAWIRDKPKRRIRSLLIGAAVVVVLIGGFKYTLDLRRERTAALAARDQAEQARDEVKSVVDFLVGLFEVSDPSEARGNTITAREILDTGSQQIAHHLRDRPLTRARMMATIGTVYSNLGLYDEAGPLLERALETRRDQLGSDDITVGESLQSLAVLYERQGDFAAAETLFLQARSIRERELGTAHPELAGTLDALAFVYLKQGRFDEAEPLLLRALEIRETSLGPEHPEVAATLRSLGILNYSLGRFDEAEAQYQRSLAIRRKVLGNDHPKVANTLNSLASLYLSQGRFDEAETLYNEALGIREMTLGGEHPQVAISLNNLAMLHFYKGEFDAAEPPYLRSLAIREAVLGPEHPDTAESLSNLAFLYYYQDRLEEADDLYRQALAIRERALPDHPSTAETLAALGSLCDDLERYREAEDFMLRALAIYEKALGPENPKTAESIHYLAHIYHRHFDRFEDAEELYRRALAINQAVLGPDDPSTQLTLGELQELLQEQDREEDLGAFAQE